VKRDGEGALGLPRGLPESDMLREALRDAPIRSSAKSSLRRRFVDSSIVCCDWRIVSRASASNRLYSTRARLPNGSAEKEGTGKLVRAPVGHFGGPLYAL